ncbi:glycosyltransferase family 4 protein [Spirulina subsalsa]|uniref:glycosyltransferase family 4 protein n=1 Tax=Spirulina TaxID=1154 RepID=UPI003A8F953A
MRILMLSATFPYPPTQGGTQVRTFNLLRYLSDRHTITLATQRAPDTTPAEIAALRDQVAELQVFKQPPAPTATMTAKLGRFAQSWLTGIPAHVRSNCAAPMAAWVAEQVESGAFDVVTCEHSGNEVYVRPGWQHRLRTVVNIHSSLSATCRQQLVMGTAEQGWRDRLNLPLLERYEHHFCHKFSELVVTTPEDRAHFEALSPGSAMTVIPNGVDLDLFPLRQADPGGTTLIFCGAMDNQPNIDAAQFLCREILPAVRQRLPEITVQLVGARPVAAVQALGSLPGVTVTGKVPSMAAALQGATVCVIPMRSGFGIKNKTLEAMAAGVPVVGSDRALEGLKADPHGALRANGVAEFVTAIETLVQNPEQRRSLSAAGRALIEREFTWAVAGARYEAVLTGTPALP